MDGQRFDNLTRVLGQALDRKQFVAALGGLLGIAAAGDLPEPAGAQGTCGGVCVKDSDCPDTGDCVCDESSGLCVTLICGGNCSKDTDCPDVAGCVCDTQLGTCETAACGGSCESDEECGDSPGCICDESELRCITVVCPGSCLDSADCQEQGQDDCVCFLGPAADVRGVGSEGVDGSCGQCRGAGDSCDATPECCGQLVCDSEVCTQKQPKPKPDRCAKHGEQCREDKDCCAQGMCYKGECGEKDTHCNNQRECADGWRCQGGPLAPGHRRCRKNGRRRRNRTHRKNG